MSVVVGIAQLVGQGIQEKVASLSVQLRGQALVDIHGRVVGHRGTACLLVLSHSLQEQEQISVRRQTGSSPCRGSPQPAGLGELAGQYTQ